MKKGKKVRRTSRARRTGVASDEHMKDGAHAQTEQVADGRAQHAHQNADAGEGRVIHRR